MDERTVFIPAWSIPLLLIILSLLWAWVLMPNDTDCDEEER